MKLHDDITLRYRRTLGLPLTSTEVLNLLDAFAPADLCALGEELDHGDGYDGIVNRAMSELESYVRREIEDGAHVDDPVLVAHGSAVSLVAVARGTLRDDESDDEADITMTLLMASRAHPDFWRPLQRAAMAVAGWLLDTHDPGGLCAGPRHGG